MPGPDRYDPLADLGTTKDKGNFSAPPIPEGGTGQNRAAEYFDSAANFGTDGHDIVIGNPNVSTPGDTPQRQPTDVNRFDGTGGLSNSPAHQDNYDAAEDK